MHNWNTRKEKRRKVQQQHCRNIDPVLSNVNDRYQATDPGCSVNIKNKYQKNNNNRKTTPRHILKLQKTIYKGNLKKKIRGKKILTIDEHGKTDSLLLIRNHESNKKME